MHLPTTYGQKILRSILFLTLLLLVGSLFPLQVNADPPLAAKLLAEPYTSTGVRVTITNFSNMYGLATDGTNVYAINSAGNVYIIPFSDIDMTAGGAVSVTGTAHTVGWGAGGAPTWPGAANLSLAYSHGCLFVTNNNNTLGQIRLYCIDISDYTVTEIDVPVDRPLPEGDYYVTSSLIDFPDGRIGKVSKYEGTSGNWTSTLRTYTVTGTGKNVTIAWSEDYLMADTAADKFARDEHGIATDGTYLYRIQWWQVAPYNYKSWALQSGASAEVSFEGHYTRPFGNMHFLAHNHIDNFYLVGHWNNNQFFITAAADPGPGPGNPLIPQFGAVTEIQGGFSVQISNYDANFVWSGIATAGGVVNVDVNGLVTVSGLASQTFATATITASRSGYPDGEADVSGTSLIVIPPPPPPPVPPPGLNPSPPPPPVYVAPATSPSSVITPTIPSEESMESPDESMVETYDITSASSSVLIRGIGFTLNIAGVDTQDNPLPLYADKVVQVISGSHVHVSGSGFLPGTEVEVWTFSDARLLGTVTISETGDFDTKPPIPTDMVAGRHTLRVAGITDTGEQSVEMQIEIVSQTQEVSLVKDIDNNTLPGLFLCSCPIALILIALILAKRRRKIKK